MSSAWNACAAAFSMLCKVATKYCHVLNAVLNLVWYFGYLQLNRLQHCISYWTSSCSDCYAASIMEFCYSQLKRHSTTLHQLLNINMFWSLCWIYHGSLLPLALKTAALLCPISVSSFKSLGFQTTPVAHSKLSFPKKYTFITLYDNSGHVS